MPRASDEGKPPIVALIDVRAMPTWQRHPRIMEAFDALGAGDELTIVNDHEPRPLRTQFEQTRSGRYVWLQRMLASDHWEVTLQRIALSEPEPAHPSLRSCALFADAAPNTLAELECAVTAKAFGQGECIAEQGAEWEHFGIVEHGAVAAVIISPFGREHTLYEVLSGEGFGEIAVISGGTVPVRFVVTSAATRVLHIPKTAMRLALARDHALTSAIADLCAQRLRIVIERFASQTSLPTVARVAAALLPHAAPEPGLQPALASFENITQVQLATAAGTVKEVASRALAELEAAGAIERKGGRIVSLDRQKLTEHAEH